MNSFIYKLAILSLSLAPVESNTVTNVIKASHDASLRRDRYDENFGDSQQITITPEGATSARVAVMKFDTAHVEEEAGAALLRLFISDSGAAPGTSNTVSIVRIHDDFHEHDVSWDSFNYKTTDEWIEFDVHHDHKGKTGQVDVSSLMVPGEDLKLAIHMKHDGHVKFASKDHVDSNIHPKLLLVDSSEF